MDTILATPSYGFEMEPAVVCPWGEVGVRESYMLSEVAYAGPAQGYVVIDVRVTEYKEHGKEHGEAARGRVERHTERLEDTKEPYTTIGQAATAAVRRMCEYTQAMAQGALRREPVATTRPALRVVSSQPKLRP